MAGLSDIFQQDTAGEGAEMAPSPSSCACSGSPLPEDPSAGLPAFGYPEKLIALQREVPHERIDGYILFGSHTDALALFDAARQEGYSVRVSPTPRAARASCGIALLVPCDEVMNVFAIAQTRRIRVENMVPLPQQINANRDRYC